MNLRRSLWAAFYGLALVLFSGSIALAEEDCEPEAGSDWAFGESGSRDDILWKKGMNPGEISQKAVPQKLGQKKSPEEEDDPVSRALEEAKKSKLRGSVGMSVKNEASTFKAGPETMRPDEFMPRDRRHIVRAFADVQPTDDLDISVGPELILKDESRGDEAAHENQPDSSLGVGMRFKLDF